MASRNSQNNEVVEYRPKPSNRVDVLEERIAIQERTLKNLIDRAFKIKEDVINSLNYTQGTWQEEQKARVLLQDHVKTITNIVNKLNHEIANIEEKIKSRDHNTVSTNTAMKNLEVHHVATLTDLRGRVVRCDTAISKLSSDMKSMAETIKSANQYQNENGNKTIERIHNLESKISGISNSIDKLNSENAIKIQSLGGDTSNQISVLDTKTRSALDDLRHMIKSRHAELKDDEEKIEFRLSQLIEKSAHDTDGKINQVYKRIDDMSKNIEARMLKLEEAMVIEKGNTESSLKAIESKLQSRISTDLRKQTTALEQVKKDSRSGFATVQETITNMRTVLDGKRRLLEEQLRKDISHIRKMVVLI